MNILITKDESDTFLSEFSDWEGLTDSNKDIYIRKASVFVQVNWLCDDVDWADLETVTDEIKEATAFYAYASYSDNLFGDVSEADTNKIKRSLNKAGSLTNETEYFQSGKVGSGSSTGYPDSLMVLSPCSKKSNSTLTRC